MDTHNVPCRASKLLTLPAWNEAIIVFLFGWCYDCPITLFHPGELELEFENLTPTGLLSPTVN